MINEVTTNNKNIKHAERMEEGARDGTQRNTLEKGQ
jgi:hypothetical protein